MARRRGSVLITGASSGIGRASALELDRAGFEVFAGVRRRRDAESLAAEGSERLVPVTLDVTRERSIASARATIERRLGRRGLAGVVNNAGIATGAPIEHMPLDEFRRVLEVNLVGGVAVTKAFLPLLRRDRGRVVFITSIGGRVAYPYMSPYHASKWGTEAVADSLRRELLPWGIRVIVIEPGTIATPIWGKGLASAAALRDAMPAEGRRRYGPMLERLEGSIEASSDRGLAPERVGRAVRRALTRRFPDTRYRVGMDARVTFVASRLLGDRLFDRLVARAMRMPRRPEP
jgi:NAD(P)-dependent dehydrogenase (short-subunit alcohol dehydrogenase family)